MNNKFLFFIFCILLANSKNVFAQPTTFTREYTYQASELDSKVSASRNASAEMQNILLREVGTFIRSEQKLEIEGDRQEYTEKIEAITAGIVSMKVLDERWDGKTYWIKAEMTVDTDDVRRILSIYTNDEKTTNELKILRDAILIEQTVSEQLKKENEELKKKLNEIEQTESEQLKKENEELQKKYDAQTDKLNALEYIRMGINAREKEDSIAARNNYEKAKEISDRSSFNPTLSNFITSFYEGSTISSSSVTIVVNGKVISYKPEVNGDDMPFEENRSVSDFTGINALGIFEITVVKGSAVSLTIKANNYVIPYVSSVVKNGVLYLNLKENAPDSVNNRTVKVTVVMKDLDYVSLSGVCKINSNDLFTPKSFTGNCSGSSSVNIKANVIGTTRMNVSGSSQIDLVGSTRNLTIDVSGTSNFRAINFIAETATINSSGTSKVSVNVTNTLSVDSSGISTVNYKGSPVIKINKSGLSTVNQI